MSDDRAEVLGEWSVKIKEWNWEYIFGADGKLTWRDLRSNEKGAGHWVKTGNLINLTWYGSTSKESWKCPIIPPNVDGWYNSTYFVGPYRAIKLLDVSKPELKKFDFISKSPPRARICGPYKDEILSETLYGYQTVPIKHLASDYSVIEVSVEKLLPQWKKLFPAPNLADSTGKIVMIASWVATATGMQSVLLRDLYKQGVDQILKQAQQMVAAGHTEAKAAEWAVTARNNLKVAVRNQGPAIIKAFNEARNKIKYKNKIGPSYQQLRTEYIIKGVPAAEVDARLIGGIVKTSDGFNKVGPRLKLAAIGGEVVGFALVAMTNSPQSLDPLPRSAKDEIEIERVRLSDYLVSYV